MPFKPGKSGNPGGRPKENHEVVELARKHTKAAISRLAEWLKSDNPKASVSAAIALLERGHGKAVQRAEITGADGGPIKTEDVSARDVLLGRIAGISDRQSADGSAGKPH